jgi:hypothetical protein
MTVDGGLVVVLTQSMVGKPEIEIKPTTKVNGKPGNQHQLEKHTKPTENPKCTGEKPEGITPTPRPPSTVRLAQQRTRRRGGVETNGIQP